MGAHAALRLDANGAWSEREAERALDALAGVPQRVCRGTRHAEVAACARLRARTRVPIALDAQSTCDATRWEIALRTGAADVLVLKLPLLGGPLAVRELGH